MTIRKTHFGGSVATVAAIGLGLAVLGAPSAWADPVTPSPTGPAPSPEASTTPTNPVQGAISQLPGLSSIPGLGGGTTDATGQAAAVPAEYTRPLQDAGQLCAQIKPWMLASQVNQASRFTSEAVPAAEVKPGSSGPAMLTPEVFKLFSSSGSTTAATASSSAAPSATSPNDSVMALGRFMCAIADKVDKANPAGAVAETSTDPTALLRQIPGLSSIPGLTQATGSAAAADTGIVGASKNTPAYLATAGLVGQKDAPDLGADAAGLDKFVEEAVKTLSKGAAGDTSAVLPGPVTKSLAQVLVQGPNYAAVLK